MYISIIHASYMRSDGALYQLFKSHPFMKNRKSHNRYLFSDYV